MKYFPPIPDLLSNGEAPSRPTAAELQSFINLGTASPHDIRRLVAEIVALRMVIEMMESMIDDGSVDGADIAAGTDMDLTEDEIAEKLMAEIAAKERIH